MSNIFKSKWICDAEFAKLQPIDVFHKEIDAKSIETEIKNHHIYFIKRFNCTNENMKIRISADDYYRLYINGRFVCEGPAPAYTEFYNYNEADISSFVHTGENTILIHAYYQGDINRVWNSGDLRFGIIADIFEDGKFLFGTDESWKYKKAEEYIAAETVGYKTAYLENIDFRLKKINYSDFKYNACLKQEVDYCFTENSVPCVEITETIPKKIIKNESGGAFVDLGKEMAGNLSFTVKGERGSAIRLICGEELENGKIKSPLRCNCDYNEKFILSGDSDVVELFNYKSFRYAEIVPDDCLIDVTSIKMIERHHRFDEDAIFFNSDNELLNNIWHMCVQTVKISTQEVFVDCPTREKGQYLGDFFVTGQSFLYLTGDTQMYERTLDSFVASTKVCKGLLAVAPGSFMQEIADFSLMFPEAVMNLYRYSGDKRIIEKYLKTCDGIIEHFMKYKTDSGLLGGVSDKWNLVDWPANLRDNYDFPLDNPMKSEKCHNCINAYYIGACKTVNKMHEILGYGQLYEVAVAEQAFINEFYDAEKALFKDFGQSKHHSLHSNALALYFGIVKDKKAIDSIAHFITEKGLCCGVWFSYFVLRGLGKIGAFDLELELLLNESEHSWANMLSEGATTCFEAWGKEQKWNTSLCHPWATSPIEIILEDLLGFHAEKGVAAFHPNIQGQLSIEVKVPYGKKSVGITCSAD